MTTKGKIYLIPTILAPDTEDKVLPPFIKEVLKNTTLYFVENIKTARRFISSLKLGIVIDSLTFIILDKKTKTEEIRPHLKAIIEGKNAGIISEAGCPGIADPGANLVDLAHQVDIQVVPLVGPSSILMALMASGLNGQNFAFNGYLPIQSSERIKKLKYLEKLSHTSGQTQIFMETPYRNNPLLKDILNNCEGESKLCIAADISSENELILTKKIKEWRKKVPDIHKKPAIFLLQA